MTFAGIQKLTLLDYPGKTACTLFTAGCNLRCPYCHNSRLVLPERRDDVQLTNEEVLTFLKKRAGLLDGVCITGGEPLLQESALREFILCVKALGYAVKIDTNGTRPEVLEALLNDRLIDYAAMDVKNAFPYYAETVGVTDFAITPIKDSIEILKNSGMDYEFRTTVVREFHTVERIRELAQSIAGAKRYFIQRFRDSGELITSGLSAVPEADMQKMREAAEEFCPTEIRG